MNSKPIDKSIHTFAGQMNHVFNKNRNARRLLHVFIVLFSTMSIAHSHVDSFDSNKLMTISDVSSELCGESKEGNIGSENLDPGDKYISNLIGSCPGYSASKNKLIVSGPVAVYSAIPEKPMNPPRA